MNAWWARVRAGHETRNDSPSYDDLKPTSRDELPADHGTHPLWCHRRHHDGPCVMSTAVTDPAGVRVKVTVTFDRDADRPVPQVSVQVGSRVAHLDGGKAGNAVLLLGSWLAPTALPHATAGVE